MKRYDSCKQRCKEKQICISGKRRVLWHFYDICMGLTSGVSGSVFVCRNKVALLKKNIQKKKAHPSTSAS